MPAKKTEGKPMNKPAEKPVNKAAEKPAEKNNVSASKAGSNAIVKVGDKVKIDYTGSFEDGVVFDSSEKHGKPLEFEVGKGMLIPGFEKAVVGMKKGDEKIIHLEACDAYGDYNPQLLKKVPREQLPKDQEPKAGMILAINLPNGMQFPAVIHAVDEKEVTLDLNHPLAGKRLNFSIKVVDINA